MKRYLALLPICLVMMTTGNLAAAGHHCRSDHRVVACPRCSTYCQLKVELGKEERGCWTIECEQICVPRVVFPWQTKAHGHHRAGHCEACSRGCGPCTCVNNGAWVRTVKKLKRHTYECPACKYEWTPKTVVCGCTAGCPACAAPENGEGEQSPVPAEPDIVSPEQAAIVPPVAEETAVSRTEVARLRFPFDWFAPAAGQRK